MARTRQTSRTTGGGGSTGGILGTLARALGGVFNKRSTGPGPTKAWTPPTQWKVLHSTRAVGGGKKPAPPQDQ